MPSPERRHFERLTDPTLPHEAFVRVLLAVYNHEITFSDEPVFEEDSKRIIVAVDHERRQPPGVRYPIEHWRELIPHSKDRSARNAILFSITALSEITDANLTHRLR